MRREWLSWEQPCLPQAARWLVDRFALLATPQGAPRPATEGRRPCPTEEAGRAHGRLGRRGDLAGRGTRDTPTLWDSAQPEANEASSTCDLQRTLCVLPGARAGRLLLAELLQVCGERGEGGLRLIPPRVLTPGAMIDELLATEAQPVASDFEAQLAWLEALRSSSDEELRPLLPEAPPRHGDHGGDPGPWMDLARKIAVLHDELSGEMRSFSEVADAAERMEMLGEGDRWRVLENVHAKQRRILGKTGLIDRNDARARSLSKPSPLLEREGEQSYSHIVLIGVVDLNALQRLALQAATADVAALIHAPPDLSDAFDDLGTARVEAWTERRIDIDDRDILIAEKPVDQAQAAMRCIAHVAAAEEPHLSASQITLGVGDADLAGDLEVAAEWAGVSVRRAAGETLARSAPARLLAALADFLEEDRLERFATLLRHPDLERAVVRSLAGDRAREEWLSLLDKYFADHLQGRATGAWLGDADARENLKPLWDSVQAILSPLHESSDSVGDALSNVPLHEWCQRVLEVLANVYAIDQTEETNVKAPAVTRAPADIRAIDACLELRDVIAQVAVVAPALQPRVDAVAALRLLLDLAVAAQFPEKRQPNQIEMLGWLELHLDPAPALIIAGFNDGRIPEAVTADAFLPDGLRRVLGLMHNARRYARDAYLLQAIVRSRSPGHLRVIVGRKSALGDPLPPSRLLLACDDQRLVRRVKMFANDLSERPSPPPIGLAHPPAEKATSRFVVPRLQQPLEAPKVMSVTEFRKYLNCPYRWALERVLHLKAFDDDEAELNPLSFGSLVHDALCGLGEDERIASNDDPEAIFRFLSNRLHRLVKDRHGSPPLPAIMIQSARVEQRLRAFAEFQAQAARDGWRIRHCEIEIKETVSLDIAGDAGMPLRGKIDRIDENIRTGQWRVIDYKTGEAGKSPIKMHHECNDLPAFSPDLVWHDLQLPLYHLLATRDASLRLPGDRIQLGYIVLPRRADGAAWLGADWTIKHLEHGIERAREIVREIRAAAATANFERNRDIDSPFDTFARICQTAAFQPLVADDSAEGEIALDVAGGDE